MVAFGACLVMPGCGAKNSATTRGDQTDGPTIELTAAPAAPAATAGSVDTDDEPVVPGLVPWQLDLLDLGFQAAAAFPMNPHIKNRSRAQERIAMAALEAGDPDLATAYGDEIKNWRRGLIAATVAEWRTERGDDTDFRRLMATAEVMAETAEDWRRDRIMTRLALALANKGEMDRATEVQESILETSEQGPFAVAAAKRMADEDFDAEVVNIRETVARGEYDSTLAALRMSVTLHGRFYEDSDRRAMLEELVTTSWRPTPMLNRLELLAGMADNAIEHGANDHALTFVARGRAILDANRFDAEFHLPQGAMLAEVEVRAGAVDAARASIRGLESSWDALNKELVPSMYHAACVRPLAEAYVAAGEPDEAMRLYRQVIELGAQNPNARPRCDDLVATVASLVTHGLQPDEEMLARLRELRAGLVSPW